jgi:hypothetical protein
MVPFLLCLSLGGSMKIILSLVTLVISLLSVHANAQYTCSDREYLRETLRKLEVKCGSSGGTLCESYTFKGSTIDGAIAACVKGGYGEAFCHQQATCKGGAPICESYTFKGSSVERAIATCARAGYGEAFCHQQASCKSTTICESYTFKGSTIEAAVAACMKNGYGEGFCHQQASCK